MKQVNTSRLEAGLIVAVDVYTPMKQLLIKAGTKLSELDISHLKFYKIPNVAIQEKPEEWEDDWRLDESISKTLPIKNGKKEMEKFMSEMAKGPKSAGSDVKSEFVKNPSIVTNQEFQIYQLKYLTNSMSHKSKIQEMIHKNENVNTEELLSSVRDLLPSGANTLGVMDMLSHMRNNDDATYAHSINVALLCNLMGKWLKWPEEEIKLLTLAGLLHDVGKSFIPENLLNKVSPLTDKEKTICQGHVAFGFKFIKDKDLDVRIKRVILNHHERCDGSGYPNHLTLDQIDDYSKIVGMIDVFDAMTSKRKYRNAICPFEVLDEFEKEGLKKFDAKFLYLFLERVAESFINRRVLLNNGQKGSIVLINRTAVSKPVVRIDDLFVDLSTLPSLKIAGVY